MLGLFKKKPKEIKRIDVYFALGYHIVIEVGTGKDLIIYRYDLVKSELEPLTKTFPEITTTINQRIEKAADLIKTYREIGRENMIVEAKVFSGRLDKQQQIEEYKLINHKKKKLENAIKRIIKPTTTSAAFKEMFYRGKSFKIRGIHGRQQEARS